MSTRDRYHKRPDQLAADREIMKWRGHLMQRDLEQRLLGRVMVEHPATPACAIGLPHRALACTALTPELVMGILFPPPNA